MNGWGSIHNNEMKTDILLLVIGQIFYITIQSDAIQQYNAK